MKLTKLLILALGLFALTASAAFANVSFISNQGPRNVAVNAQTGEVSNIELVATRGELGDPATAPPNESIFLTFETDISSYTDITVTIEIGDPGFVNQYSTGISGYNTWMPISEFARVRVGLGPGNYTIIELEFLEEVDFYAGNSIQFAGVRLNIAALKLGVGEYVRADFSSALGDAVVTNGLDLVVAVTRDPLTCSDDDAGCDDDVSFRRDGSPNDNQARIKIAEKFPMTHAFEAGAIVRLDISGIPTGFDFEGCNDLTFGTEGSPPGPAISGYVNSYASSNYCLVYIEQSDASRFEWFFIDLEFALDDTPDFDPSSATVTAYLYPADSGPYPWYGDGADYYQWYLKYTKLPVVCTIDFDVSDPYGARLLSVFNASDDVWETGYAIMNGSGVSEELITQYGRNQENTVPVNGTVKVYMWPMYTDDSEDPFGYGAGTGRAYITTTGPNNILGLGLNEYGQVPFNGTWAVLNTELCDVATLDADDDLVQDTSETKTCAASGTAFEGFVIFETQFRNAEGVNFIADWAGDNTMSHGYPMINLRWKDKQIRAYSEILD